LRAPLPHEKPIVKILVTDDRFLDLKFNPAIIVRVHE
jgi:hypothetical protein